MKLSKKTKNLLKFVKLKKERLFLFFDYDGVLVPLQNNPATAYLPSKVKKGLLELSFKKNIKVALVSGRNLHLLKKLTKLRSKNITLIGSHGLEMYYKGTTKHIFDKNLKDLKSIKKEATKLAKDIASGFVENKPYSFTYHIRDKKKNDFVQKICSAVNSLIKKRGLSKKLKVLKGKKMVEILPCDVNKGSAVEKLISLSPKYKYVYFGDDVTDISAFKIVNKYKGIPVSLNKKLPYKTKYTLNLPADVWNFIYNLN